MDMLTITLTGALPVCIRKADWPILAEVAQGQDGLKLTVRRHADGRAIVYAVADARVEPGRRRGGRVYESGADLVGALREVGADMDLPSALIQWCTAKLPAVAL